MYIRVVHHHDNRLLLQELAAPVRLPLCACYIIAYMLIKLHSAHTAVRAQCAVVQMYIIPRTLL
jgi:hypothetical protein